MFHGTRNNRFARVPIYLLVLLLAACGLLGTPFVDLDGRVVDAFGIGVPGISVAPVGSTATVTASDGSFAFADVETPYDVVAFSTADEWAHVFLGLSSPQPEIVPFEAMFGGSSPPESSATINVTDDVLVLANQVLTLCVENPNVGLMGCTEVEQGDPSPTSLSVDWFGTGSVDATVRGVLFSLGADGVPTDALRMGTGTVNVSDGASVALALSTSVISDVDVTVNVNEPSGVSLDGLVAVVALPDGHNSMSMPFGHPTGTPATIALPDIPGASVIVVAAASDPASVTSLVWGDPVALATTSIDLDLPTAPAVMHPADGATGVGSGDTFQVEDRPNEAFTFIVGPDVGSGPDVLMTSVDGSLVLPDMSSYGAALALPAATVYDWRVTVHTPVANANALVTAGGSAAGYTAIMLAGSAGYGPGPTAAGSFQILNERSFTTP